MPDGHRKDDARSSTTFATFSHETLQLVANVDLLTAGATIAGSVAATLIAVDLGTLLARAA